MWLGQGDGWYAYEAAERGNSSVAGMPSAGVELSRVEPSRAELS